MNFAELANLAEKQEKPLTFTSELLIDEEKSPLKKIPYWIETKKYFEALEKTVSESGDPNIIYYALDEIFK